MKNKILRIVAFAVATLMLVSLMCACEKDNKTEEPPNTNLYDLTGFKIVREDLGNANVSNATGDLKRAIKNIVGVDLAVSLDSETEIGEKEILVGETNRPESVATLSYIKGTYGEKDGYAIRIAPNKIVIMGSDNQSTERAIYEFINDYVRVSPEGSSLDISAGAQKIAPYDADSIITTSSGVELHVDLKKQLFSANKNRIISADGNIFIPVSASYPSVTELRYQSDPKNNGKLIAIMSMNANELTQISNATGGCVMMSENQGKTWETLARPTETLYPALGSVGSMAHIYELPAKVGDMPAGTLLYSYNSVNYDRPYGENGRSILAVWRSFDCGYTWQEYVVIDEAKGLTLGIWEPFMTYCEEDGYLYCFYSDDSDPKHDQKIVYKRSKDGVHWEGKDGKIGTGTGIDVEPVDVVAAPKFKYRPGMPVITKMGNGEYFLVYEQFGDWSGCPIYYKTTKNLADWGDPADIGTLIQTPKGETMSSSPACIWIDAGGECGTLIVTAKYGSNKGFMMVSFDYGETWEKISNPLTGRPIKSDGDRVGYSPSFWLGADGKTLYYMSSINDAENPENTQVMGFAKITVYGPKSYDGNDK